MRKVWFNYLIITLLIVGQCASVLHAAEFGTDHHEHDGIACSVILPEDDYDIVTPETIDHFDLVLDNNIPAKRISPLFFSSTYTVLPPPTGPPTYG